MSDDDEGSPEKSYLGQKKEVLEVLSEYIERGNAFINDESKPEEARQEVETGLSIFRASIIGFYEFLEAGFVVGGLEDPYILNIAQYLRGALAGASATIRHIDAPDLGTDIPQEVAAKIARDAKQPGDETRKGKQREVLREIIGSRAVTQPYKEADAIFNTDTERARFETVCEKHGIDPFERSTARRRFVEMTVSKKV